MANRITELIVNIVANARGAKSEIDSIQDDVRQLEDGVKVDITADDQASDELRDIRGKLDDLSEKDRVIALKGNAAQLETEIRRAERRLGDLEKYDGETIRVTIDARDQASRKLEAIQDELRQIDGETVRADVQVDGIDGIKSKFDDLTGGAGAAAGGGLIGAAVAGMMALDTAFADAAIRAQAFATLTGASLENSSRLLEVFSDAGFEFDDLFDIVSQMNQTLADSPELANDLNINLNDGKDILERFVEVTQNLQTEIDDAGERGRIASQLFGEEGVRQVAIIQTSVGDLQTAMDGIADTRIISADDVEKARTIKQELAEAQGFLTGLQRGLQTVSGDRGFFGGFVDTFLPTSTVSERSRRLAESRTTTSPGVTAIVDQFNSNLDRLRASTINIINPAGTPATTAEDIRFYNLRNGRG